ncbi:MAG: hypothetical protein P8106_12315 [Gammaproteobacteria bacterium]
MIAEFFIALLTAGLPVGATAFALTWWALRNGYVGEVQGVRDIEREVKRLARDKERRRRADPVQRKWLKLGGGFYGVVAMLTLVVIEAGDLWNFLRSFDGLAAFFNRLSLDLLVGLLVEAIKNTFLAIAWPVYWMDSLEMHNLGAWLLAAWLGYWGGSALASRLFRKRLDDRG